MHAIVITPAPSPQGIIMTVHPTPPFPRMRTYQATVNARRPLHRARRRQGDDRGGKSRSRHREVIKVDCGGQKKASNEDLSVLVHLAMIDNIKGRRQGLMCHASAMLGIQSCPTKSLYAPRCHMPGCRHLRYWESRTPSSRYPVVKNKGEGGLIV